MNLFARKRECHQLRIKLDRFVGDDLNICKDGIWTHCYKSDYIIMERAEMAKRKNNMDKSYKQIHDW